MYIINKRLKRHTRYTHTLKSHCLLDKSLHFQFQLSHPTNLCLAANSIKTCGTCMYVCIGICYMHVHLSKLNYPNYNFKKFQ